MNSVLVLYAPVLHRGYLNLFEKYKGEVEAIYLLSPELIKDFFSLHEEIRALDAEVIKKFIEALAIFKNVSVLTPESILKLKGARIIVADETVSREFVSRYISQEMVQFEPVFLRWDESSVKKESAIHYDRESSDPFDREIMARAAQEVNKSSDWWRRVGAVLVKDGKDILETHNKHVPSEHQPYIDGDPRDSIVAGKNPELSTALHAEQAVITEAARRGISLEGSFLYVTAFPCTMCSKLVAYSGIKKVFFKEGSAILDGERVLKANGIEIILVK